MFETAVEAGDDDLIVVVGYEAAQIVDRFDDAFEGVPITYVHQRDRLGLGHAVLRKFEEKAWRFSVGMNPTTSTRTTFDVRTGILSEWLSSEEVTEAACPPT
ncbi:hypothetical protein [Halorubrum halophilum]|uniref:hypothetical protein n=1 Tax=Halorubrum halophilum TaxID=413816 RepID=UPI0012ABE5AB|nr:hypothetical protein [Halorubrum halophilum]